MNCSCWRQHSKDFPRGVTPPKTLESLQAAWDRDQELIAEQVALIASLKATINTLKQRHK